MTRRRRRYIVRRISALALLLGAVAVALLASGVVGGGSGGGPSAPRAPAEATAAPPAPVLDGGSFGGDPEALTAGRGIGLDAPPAFRLRFRHPPRSGLVFDLDSGEALWSHRPERELPVASLTKMMTALVVAENTRSNERVRITRAALDYSGSGVGKLPKGRRVPIEALLHGLMLPSGNDAAIALAVHAAGSERRFVELMNERARDLALPCTNFVSSHGLERGNRSCAADLAALARADMGKRRIARVVRKRSAVLRFPIKGRKLFLYTTNPLLRARYPGAIGLKTGYTDAAGRCFVGVARRNGRTLGVVLLGSPDPGRQARKLLNAAFRAG